MSLKSRAQDLFGRLGYVGSFVIRTSEHFEVGGKGLHTGCNFNFQSKTLCVIYFTCFFLPLFPFQLCLLFNSYYRSQLLAKVAHKNDSSEAEAHAHPRIAQQYLYTLQFEFPEHITLTIAAGDPKMISGSKMSQLLMVTLLAQGQTTELSVQHSLVRNWTDFAFLLNESETPRCLVKNRLWV